MFLHWKSAACSTQRERERERESERVTQSKKNRRGLADVGLGAVLVDLDKAADDDRLGRSLQGLMWVWLVCEKAERTCHALCRLTPRIVAQHTCFVGDITCHAGDTIYQA